jgi:dihydroorotate dehydrogenase electron transfer subunit
LIKGIEAISAPVVDIFPVAEGIYELEMLAPSVAEKAKPGQFLMVRPSADGQHLLGRPMGIYDVNLQAGTISILFEVHGKGTSLLAQVKKGDVLPLIAPLGNGFTLVDGDKKALVIGGGIGVAPLYPLLLELAKRGVETEILLGAQTGERMLALDRLVKLDMPVHLYTDNGTMGKKGYPSDNLAEMLAGGDVDRVYCCGPMPLMRNVARICEAAGVPCQVSLEERMGCGFGICVGCVIDHKAADGTISKKRVCYDGPVFDGREVIWHG